MVEKFGYGASLLALYLQHRLHASDLVFGGADVLFGLLFLLAFFKLRLRSSSLGSSVQTQSSKSL
jgi:hypothetical protein